MDMLMGGSMTRGYFRLSGLLEQLRNTGPFDLAFGFSSSVLGYLQAAQAKSRVIDLCDADSVKWQAYADKAGPLQRLIYRREARGVRKLENRAVEICQAVFFASKAEADAFGNPSPKILPVGNGVDAEYFQPASQAPEPQPPRLVFTGTMDYRPNVEGVCWFAEKIMPAVREQIPSAIFQIVGRNPAKSVQALAERDDVEVTGSVPDVRPYLGGAAVAVCPLLTARGLQNKVLEAMAAGLCVIGSAQAMEGLDVELGTEALVAQTPEEWVGSIRQAVEDQAFRTRIGQAARRRILADYNWASRLEPLVATCLDLAGANTPARQEAPVTAEAGGGK
jgi:sugar transferase (PEP-CTERM/EpsH1 system associated)